MCIVYCLPKANFKKIWQRIGYEIEFEIYFLFEKAMIDEMSGSTISKS
jgi:hypothetical protein